MKKAKFLTFTAKCSDMFGAAITDDQYSELAALKDYVPRGLGIGGGDYVTMTINLDTGQIDKWTRPTDDALTDAFPALDEEHHVADE